MMKLTEVDYEEIDHIITLFQQNKIKMTKYNHALDEIVQKFTSCEAFMQLSNNEEELIITKKVRVNKDEYCLNGDPDKIAKLK